MWAEEEVRRVKIHFSCKNFEGQDEVSSEAPAFQRDEVELVKPFLIWYVTEAYHYTCCISRWLMSALRNGDLASLGVENDGTVQCDKGCFGQFDERTANHKSRVKGNPKVSDVCDRGVR